MTPFEKRLAATPLRELPGTWRSRILAGAPRTSLSWLWPHPAAWGALAAPWVIMAVLSASGPDSAKVQAFSPAGMKPEAITAETYLASRRLQEILLADEPSRVAWEGVKP